MNAVAVTGVEEPEAPVCLADGSFYLVEMSKARHCVTHVSAAGRKRVVAVTGGRPNGLAVDGDGNLWVAEASEGALLCLSPDGRTLKSLKGSEDGPFLWPNDLAFSADGLLYMTDSGIRDVDFIDPSGSGVRTDYADLSYDGRVFEIDARVPCVRRTLDRALRFANGIAFGPDGRLYVAETLTGAIVSYDPRDPVPARRPFGNCLEPYGPAAPVGPDGMKFGKDGRLYCTVYGRSCVAVFDPDGSVVDRIATRGSKPTNIAFRPGSTEALVTEVALAQVEIIATPTEGLPLFYPRGLTPAPV